MTLSSETLREMRKLAGYLRPHWKLLPVLFLFVAVYGGGMSLRAYILKPVMEQLTAPDMEQVKRIFWVVAGVAAVMAVSALAKEYTRRWLLFRILADIRYRLTAHILTLSMRFFNEQRVGELMSKLTNDIEATRNGLRFFTGDAIQQPIFLLALGVTAFVISWKLSLFTFLILPVLFVTIVSFGRQIRKSSKKGLGKLADVTEAMQQFITGVKVVKAFRAEALETDRFRRINEAHFRRMLRVAWTKSLSISLNELLYNAGAAGLVLVGMVLVMEYEVVEVPELVAFMAVVFSMYQPTKSLSKAYSNIQESVAGASRVFGLLEEEADIEDAPDAVEMGPVQRSIAFRSVRFAYTDQPVLRDVSYETAPGTVTALVGESGAGKTTFTDLLLRFYDPDEGSVEIDGVDIRRIRRDSLLRSMAVVTQDPFLFNATIAENIRYGKPDASDEEIRQAARMAYIHDVIETEVEGGYDALVGERGAKLSGGQCQRLTIARALISDPQILILDEATSSLDSESEEKVQAALRNLMQGRTTFVVAHRLSTIRDADTILVLENGRIVEQGTHEELLARDGAYARLHRRQFAEEAPPDAAPPSGAGG